MVTTDITLTKTAIEDLDILFQIQQDEEAIQLAAFTPKDHGDKEAYIRKFTRLLADPTIHMKTVKLNDEIIGSIARFYIESHAEITYWLHRKYWGKGIGTTVLLEFLKVESIKPLYGRVAYDNYGSQKLLEKGGFIKIGTDKGFANARGKEIEEYIYMLSD